MEINNLLSRRGEFYLTERKHRSNNKTKQNAGIEIGVTYPSKHFSFVGRCAPNGNFLGGEYYNMLFIF